MGPIVPLFLKSAQFVAICRSQVWSGALKRNIARISLPRTKLLTRWRISMAYELPVDLAQIRFASQKKGGGRRGGGRGALERTELIFFSRRIRVHGRVKLFGIFRKYLHTLLKWILKKMFLQLWNNVFKFSLLFMLYRYFSIHGFGLLYILYISEFHIFKD